MKTARKRVYSAIFGSLGFLCWAPAQAGPSCTQTLDALAKMKTSPARLEAPVRERLTSQMWKTAENILGTDAKPAAASPRVLSGTGILKQSYSGDDAPSSSITLYFDRHGLLKAYRLHSAGTTRGKCIDERLGTRAGARE